MKAVKKREEEKCEEEKREEAPHFKYKSLEEEEMVSELAEETQYFNRKFAEALNRLSSCELTHHFLLFQRFVFKMRCFFTLLHRLHKFAEFVGLGVARAMHTLKDISSAISPHSHD